MSQATDLGYQEDETIAREETRQEMPPAQQKLSVIQTDDRGMISPIDSAEEARYAHMLLKSGAIPSCFQTAEQAIMGVQMCRALGVDPVLGIRQIMVVPKHNTLAAWGELPKAACERYIEHYREIRIDKEYNVISLANKNFGSPVYGVVVELKRIGNPIICEEYFTIDDAQLAGLLGDQRTPWHKYPRRMMTMRARSLALKNVFPDRLSGVAIAEYDFNILDGRGQPTFGDGVRDSKGEALADEIAAMVQDETHNA